MNNSSDRTSGNEPVVVSVVVPAYNEGEAIRETLRGIKKSLSAYGVRSYECIIIDDGSTDNTNAEGAAEDVIIVRHPYNKGYGAAIKTGVRTATGDIVIIIDADGQHNPKDISRFLQQLKDYDMVVGERASQQGVPYWRRPGKVLLKWVFAYLVNRRMADFNCGFRVFHRSYLLSILPLMPDGFSFSTTSTICGLRHGLSVGFLPIHCQDRKGRSTVSLADGFRTLLLITRLGILFSPLRTFLPLVLGLFILGAYFVTNSYIVDSQASLKGIIVVLASLVTLLFALLLDQISAIRRGENVARS